jgi:general secretion pathway protein A
LLLKYFNLRDQPFGVTPDPSYLFDTPTHREALAGLLYGIQSGLGFIALTAEPGMGKTTILFAALGRLGKTAKTVFLFQAIHNPTELFRALLIDLGENDPQGTLIDLEIRLNDILAKQDESGQRLVLVLDEAQNLNHSVLEAVRMLSNFETTRHKLLQVILCGQHQLAERLAEPELLQLRQRISIFATLKPLTRLETANYIDHRLKVAGYEGPNPLFTPEAVSLIAHYSGGIPRNINNLCFNALSIGCALGKQVIDSEVVREAIGDLGLQVEMNAESVSVPEVERDMFVRPAPSETRETRPALRVASIAALLFIAALTAGGWYLTRTGALHFPEISRASSSLRNSPPMPPPMKDQAPAPASPQGDSSAQASTAQQGDAPARPSAGSLDDSAAQAAASASETQAAADSEAPTPPAARPSKRKRTWSASRPQPYKTAANGRMTTANGGVQVVAARRGQSFVGICVEKFDGCSPALLNRIIELNPSIADPHHLQAGQRIFLPVLESQTGPGNRSPSGE